MTIKIGKVGLDVAMTSPRDWKQAGDRISIGGVYEAASLAEARVLRRQIVGYDRNDDEPVIPVIWTPDGDAEGYYRVLSANVDTHGASLAHGRFDWAMELERVSDYTSPLFESVVVGALLANAHGIASGTAIPFHAVPATATEYRYGSGGFFSTRPSADGDMQWFTNGVYSATPRYYITPADFYDGGATLSTDIGPDPHPVVGRQIIQQPYDWIISNGLVQVSAVDYSASKIRLLVQHYESGAYQSGKVYSIKGETTAGFVNELLHVAVLRNSPEEVAIRLSCRTEYGINWGRVTFDVSLRRGDRFVRCFLQSDAQSNWSVSRDDIEGSNGLTGGIEALVDDAQGNRYVVATSYAHTHDGNGKLTQSGGAVHNKFDFGLGSAIGGSGASGYDAAQSQIYQYFAAQSERMTLVGR